MLRELFYSLVLTFMVSIQGFAAVHPISEPRYQIRQCDRQGCGLRYPVLATHLSSERCPRCRGNTHLVQLAGVDRQPWRASVPQREVHLEALLDNIRSAWNVGSIFRSADGIGVRHLHLCGITSTPEIPKVVKTSLGAEKAVGWSYHPDGFARVSELKRAGLRVWALEWTETAQAIQDSLEAVSGSPLVLVVGNELGGVDPAIIQQCEKVVYLPMLGLKRSFNAAVAFGIAAYLLCTAAPT